MDPHDEALSKAFDDRALDFELSAPMSDAAALARLVAFAALAPGAHVLDAGCGPGLVAEAFLAAGHRVTGVDLSAKMVVRARARCERFGDRARFEHGRLEALPEDPAFDAAVSRLVLHHVEDPLGFLREQVRRVRPGGVVVANDMVTDADPAAARWHREVEKARDTTHTRNLTAGEIVDAFASAGLASVSLAEAPFELDFDEWFDRGTPGRPKQDVRALLLAGRARAFEPQPRPGGRIAIRALRVLVRGVRPA